MSGDELACPMPDCGAPLCLEWSMTYTFSADDLDEGQEMAEPRWAHSSGWTVECHEGHIILVPGPPRCDCDDPQGEGCPHPEADYDWSDDNRTWRPVDVVRLRHTLATLGGAR